MRRRLKDGASGRRPSGFAPPAFQDHRQVAERAHRVIADPIGKVAGRTLIRCSFNASTGLLATRLATKRPGRM